MKKTIIKNHHLCACGKCDKLVSSDKRFAHGHNRQGTKQTEETILKIKNANLETYSKPEIRIKVQGKNNGFYNKSHSKDFCNLQQIRGKNRFNNEQFRKKHAKATKDGLNNPIVKTKISSSSKKMWENQETRKILSKARKSYWGRSDIRNNKSQVEKERWQNLSPEEKELRRIKLKNGFTFYVKLSISKSVTDLWKTQDYVNKQLKSRAIKPNGAETIVLNVLNDVYPNEWKYTGDFSFTVDGKSPDFTNISGQNKLIELFGDYWHKGENPQDRINIFKPFGWDTLVIWESELKDVETLKNKIIEFNERSNAA